MKTITQSRQLGFTLIELLLAVAVLGILMSLAVPGFQSMMLGTQVRTAAETVQIGLQRARAEAISRNTNIIFTLNADTSWSLDYETKPNLTDAPIDQKAAKEGTKNVSAVALAGDLTPATSITFNNLGRVIPNTDKSASLAQIDFSATGTDRTMRVTVGVWNAATSQYVGGNARMCDPNPKLAKTNPSAC